MAGLAQPACAQEGKTPVVTTAPYSGRAHDELVEAIRAARATPADALATLDQWQAMPLDDAARRRVASDAVVWAAASDDTALAVKWARSVPIDALAVYALDPAFRAARRVGDRELEGAALQQLRTRSPSPWPARLLDVFWLVDTGEPARAEQALAALATDFPTPDNAQRADWLDAKAAVAQARGKPLQALEAYGDLSALDPRRLYAAREGIFVLAREGAPSAAFAQAQTLERGRAGAFTPYELATLRQQSLGQQLRWAQSERDQLSGPGSARFAALDALLPQFERASAEADAQATRAEPGSAAARDWRALSQRLDFDRMSGLNARGRFPEVVAIHGRLKADGVRIPYYALSAAAGAYQQTRRSDLAVPIYEEALADAGDRLPIPSDTHVGLTYAYIDTGRFEEAEALLQRMEGATPPLLRLTPEQGRANPEYTEVRNLRALVQLYTDHPGEAERSFDALTSMAPLSAGLRTGQAETARLRQRPDAALARYQETLTDHPDDIPARAGYAGTLLEAGRLREGRELADRLEAEAPESVAVRNTVRLRDAVMAPRIEVDADAAHDGGALANREWRVDSRVTSPWLDDQWRVYYRQVFARGDTDIGNVRFARSGLGLEWQQDRWNLRGEVHHANDGRYRNGAALAARYRASDNWRFAAEFDTNSLDTPWKARRADVGAHSLALSTTFVASESRSIEARWQRLDFSDGNLRDALGLTWRERWITGPRFTLDSTAGIEGGNARRQDVVYFSPAHESAQQLGLRARYLTWKRDDRRFTQEVEASGGAYQQSGFGSGPLWSLRYAHEWEFGPGRLLRYGIGISSQPYDGVRERRRFVFLNLSFPLR